MEGWDPRVEDYHDHRSVTADAPGPLSNFSRTPNLARMQDSVQEPRGLYITNVPVGMTSENLKKMFSEHGKVLSAFIGTPNSKFAAKNITWGIVKVPTMREALSLIQVMNNKPPLYLRVELSLTEEERKRRREEKENDKQFQQNVEDNTLNYAAFNDIPSPITSQSSSTKMSLGRGKMINNNINNIPITEPIEERNSVDVVPEKSPIYQEKEPAVPEQVVVEMGHGSVMVKPRKPLPCIFCGADGKVRCSVCKAWYCGKPCQVDDWFEHKNQCIPPPSLESPDDSENNAREKTALAFRNIDETKYRKEERKYSMQKYIYQEDTVGRVIYESNTEPFRRRHKTIVEKPLCTTPSNNVPISNNINGNRSCNSNDLSPSFTRDDVLLQHTPVQNKTHAPAQDKQENVQLIPAQEIQASPAQDQISSAPAQNKIQLAAAQDKIPLPNAQNETQLTPGENLTQLEPSHAQKEIQPISGHDKIQLTPKDNIPPLPTQDNIQLTPAQNNIQLTPAQNNIQPSPAQNQTQLQPLAHNQQPGVAKDLLSQAQSLPCLSSALKLGELYEASVSIDDDSGCIYTQVIMDGSIEIFSNFHNTLASDSTEESFKPDVGALVAAQSTSDQAWYRAFVWECLEDGYAVCYIDFGNSEVVSTIKPLPDNFSHTPGLLLVGRLNLKSKMHMLLKERAKEGSLVSFRVIEKRKELIKVSLINNNSDSVNFGDYIMMPWYSQLPVPDVEIKYSSINGEFFEDKDSELGDLPYLEVNKDSSNTTVTGLGDIYKDPSSISQDCTSVVGENLDRNAENVDRNVDKTQASSINLSELPSLVTNESPYDSEFGTESKVSEIVSEKVSEILSKPEVSETQEIIREKRSEVVDEKVSGISIGPAKDEITAATREKFWGGDLKKSVLGEGENLVLPVWVDEENNFYVHTVTEENAAMYEGLHGAVNLHCEKGAAVIEVEVGELVCGYAKDDNTWYRAKVTSVHSNRACVQFIDFGNTEDLPLSELKEFSASLMAFPVLSLKVQLEGVKKGDKVAHKKLLDLIDSHSILILKSHGDAGVQIFNEGKLVNESLVTQNVTGDQKNVHKSETLQSTPKNSDINLMQDKEQTNNMTKEKEKATSMSQNTHKNSDYKLTQDKKQTTYMTKESEQATTLSQNTPKNSGDNLMHNKEQALENTPMKYDINLRQSTTSQNITDNLSNGLGPPMYQDCKTSMLKAGGDADVFILEAVNPFAIFLVAQEFVPYFVDIAEMSGKMEEYFRKQPFSLHRPILGEVCLALFSEDKKWYRAACVQPEMESAKVFFVDYGNSEDVLHTNIRPIPASFLDIPCMAVHCIMSGLDDDDIKDGASTRLAELLPANTIQTITVLDQNDNQTYNIDIPEIRKILVAEGLVKIK